MKFGIKIYSSNTWLQSKKDIEPQKKYSSFHIKSIQQEELKNIEDKQNSSFLKSLPKKNFTRPKTNINNKLYHGIMSQCKEQESRNQLVATLPKYILGMRQEASTDHIRTYIHDQVQPSKLIYFENQQESFNQSQDGPIFQELNSSKYSNSRLAIQNMQQLNKISDRNTPLKTLQNKLSSFADIDTALRKGRRSMCSDSQMKIKAQQHKSLHQPLRNNRILMQQSSGSNPQVYGVQISTGWGRAQQFSNEMLNTSIKTVGQTGFSHFHKAPLDLQLADQVKVDKKGPLKFQLLSLSKKKKAQSASRKMKRLILNLNFSKKIQPEERILTQQQLDQIQQRKPRNVYSKKEQETMTSVKLPTERSIEPQLIPDDQKFELRVEFSLKKSNRQASDVNKTFSYENQSNYYSPYSPLVQNNLFDFQQFPKYLEETQGSPLKKWLKESRKEETQDKNKF